MPDIAAFAAPRLLARNDVLEAFFLREAGPIARACREMSDRFRRGGRLLAFGCGPYALEAHDVSIEFPHPPLVGQPPLPALDLSHRIGADLDAVLAPEDIVMGFGPPDGDADIWNALARASRRGAMTLALPGADGFYAMPAATHDAFVHQELLGVLHHALRETVPLFLEHRQLGHDAVGEVAESILTNVDDDSRLRVETAAWHGETIGRVAAEIMARVDRGGTVLLFGSGASAAHARDWALDCVLPPSGYRTVPAISLAPDTRHPGGANDTGGGALLRQIAAHGRAGDVAIAISSTRGSRADVVALEDARRRGLFTVALLGDDGGDILRRRLADAVILVASDRIPRVHEVQSSIGHVLREAMDAAAAA